MKSLQSITVIIYWSVPKGTHEAGEGGGNDRVRRNEEESEEREPCENNVANMSHVFTEQIWDETLTIHNVITKVETLKKLINTFIQWRRIELIKSVSEDIYVSKGFYFK